MRPEDIDKLFQERLGNTRPTPSADLWNRLQNRIEEEMPVVEEKKPIMLWARSYAAAAAITVLLSAGVVFYNVQQDAKEIETDALAQTEQPVSTQKPALADETDKWVNKSLAVTEEPVPATPETIAEEQIIAPVEEEKVATIAKAAPIAKAQKEERKQLPVVTSNSSKGMFASAATKPKQESEKNISDQATTQVAFASNRVDMNAAPVEIIIKRSVALETAAPEVTEEPASDFKKKQKLVKNIFKQVKNLSNGEQVNLSELGLNADRIALETQIGKQKISKVINL